MKKAILYVIVLAVFAAGSFFIVRSFKASAPPPEVPEPPDLEEAPARVYGKTEPEEREVYVSPPVSRRIVAVHVSEGDTVSRGEELFTLERSVEEAQLNLAQARVQAAERQLAIDRDTFERNRGRYEKKAISEYEYHQSLLRVELDKSNLEVARKEAELAKAALERLTLKSPIDGLVYKFDVRLGETLPVGENSRIILGSADLWVRAYVEAFWMNRVEKGDFYDVYSTETKDYLGTGEVIYAAPYMGRRNFRTEDLQERFDTKFQEVVLALAKGDEQVPIGLSVYIELIQD
jgi:multidrug efflux pump subunit AcrA (membrane-fusion protein)